jgi:hypothetical protein
VRLTRLAYALLALLVVLPLSASEFGRGPLFNLYDTPTLGWEWYNQGGTALLKESKDQAVIRVPGANGRHVRLRIRAAPATPYTVTAAFTFHQFSATTPNVAMGPILLALDPVTTRWTGPGVVQNLSAGHHYVHWLNATQSNNTIAASGAPLLRWWAYPV